MINIVSGNEITTVGQIITSSSIGGLPISSRSTTALHNPEYNVHISWSLSAYENWCQTIIYSKRMGYADDRHMHRYYSLLHMV